MNTYYQKFVTPFQGQRPWVRCATRLFMLILCCITLSACVARSPSSTLDQSDQDAWLTAEDFEDDMDLSGLSPEERKIYERRIAERRVGEAWVPTGSYARSDANSLIMETAKTALGTPYVRGGSNTNGFDCSGFVKWTYDHFGVKLPRTAREQASVGMPVDDNDIQVGDIVAFRHPRRGYHTGIYVGEGKFIHSPRKRTVVRINSLDDPYFKTTYLGARRVDLADDMNMEEARRVLADYQTDNAHKPTLMATTTSKKSSRATSRSSSKVSSKKNTKKSMATSAAKSTSKKDTAKQPSQSAKKTSVASYNAKSTSKANTSAKTSAKASKSASKKSKAATPSASKSQPKTTRASSKPSTSKTVAAKSSQASAKKTSKP